MNKIKEFILKKIIVDVGAEGFPYGCYGDVTNVLNESVFNEWVSGDREIYLFECYQESFLKLKEKYDNFDNIFIYDTALSNYSGSAVFYKTQKKQCSSLLKPNKKILHNRKDIIKYSTIEVEVDTLDNILGHLSHIDYLKLDTQGSEYEILLGAKELLKVTDKIKCEVEFTEWYEGQKLEKDIIELLSDYGFKEISRKKFDKSCCDIFFEKIKLEENGENNI